MDHLLVNNKLIIASSHRTLDDRSSATCTCKYAINSLSSRFHTHRRVFQCIEVQPCDPKSNCQNLSPGFYCTDCPPGYTSPIIQGVGIEYARQNKQVDNGCYRTVSCISQVRGKSPFFIHGHLYIVDKICVLVSSW